MLGYQHLVIFLGPVIPPLKIATIFDQPQPPGVPPLVQPFFGNVSGLRQNRFLGLLIDQKFFGCAALGRGSLYQSVFVVEGMRFVVKRASVLNKKLFLPLISIRRLSSYDFLNGRLQLPKNALVLGALASRFGHEGKGVFRFLSEEKVATHRRRVLLSLLNSGSHRFSLRFVSWKEPSVDLSAWRGFSILFYEVCWHFS